MNKAFEVKPGDKIIYRSLYEVKETTVVEKPIDDSYERPKFAIGRLDLDNGEYLPAGATIYDSVEECKEDIRKDLHKQIKEAEKTIKYYNASLILLKKRLELL